MLGRKINYYIGMKDMDMKKIDKAVKGLFVAGALLAVGSSFAATQGTLMAPQQVISISL